MPCNINNIISYYLGSSDTCTGKIARILAIMSANSFFCALSSGIISIFLYLFTSELENNKDLAILSSYTFATTAIGMTSFSAAIIVGKGLCGDCSVYSSSISSLPPESCDTPNSYNISPVLSPLYTSSSSGVYSNNLSLGSTP